MMSSSSASSNASATEEVTIVTNIEYCKPVAKKRKHQDEKEERFRKLRAACETILDCVGEDKTREGLVKTPERWARSLMDLTSGYHQTIPQVVNEAVFTAESSDLVLVKDLDVFSLCEHHMLPFSGKCHIAYIPNSKLLGLSKFAKLVELYSRRLQIQERLVHQIADAIDTILSPKGVAVYLESSHFCMIMRGVRHTNSSSASRSYKGCFQTDAALRQEFLQLLK